MAEPKDVSLGNSREGVCTEEALGWNEGVGGRERVRLTLQLWEGEKVEEEDWEGEWEREERRDWEDTPVVGIGVDDEEGVRLTDPES